MALLGIYLVACGLLTLAGLAKVWRPQDTARALAQLVRRGGSRPGVSLEGVVWGVRVFAGLEVAVGLVGLLYPQRVLAVLVALSYLTFAGFVLYARAQGGALATCGCFGSPDTPPTVLHSVVDAVLAAGAIGVAVASPRGTMAGVLAGQTFDGLPLVAASAITAALAFAVLSPLSRLSALRHLDPLRASR